MGPRSGRSGAAWAASAVGMAMAISASPPAVTVAKGETGVVHTVPGPSVNPRNGLRLTVDTRWVEGPGYRPVRIELRATTAGIADRTVTVQFRVGLQAGQGESSIEVEQQIELPAGATAVDAVLAVPHYEPWRAISWNTWIDGRQVVELSVPWLRNPAGRYQNQGDLPAVLAVGAANAIASDLGGLASRLGMASGALRGVQRVTGTGRTAGPAAEKFTTLAVAELPSRWIDYSCVDIVCLSAATLRQLEAQRPAALRAIRAWTGAGGNLWIYGVGDRWERLGEIERLTGLPPPLPPEEPADRSPRGWQLPHGREPRGDFWPAGNSATPRNSGIGRGPTPRRSVEVRAAPRNIAQPGFAWRSRQFGQVVVMGSDAPFPGSTQVASLPTRPAAARAQADSNRVSLEWLFGTVGPERFLWEHRHGLSTRLPTSDFWGFLIPGVGLAPVTAFLVLITLFVLALGPLNYYLLYRRNRLHLLIVTVPVTAVIVTSGLFAYALFADGLATRVRARSLTVLDQRQAHLVRWTRLSYYAGLTPPAGLTFPTDTVVFPLLPTEGSFHRGRSYQRLTGLGLEWSASQHLNPGWLRARTPTQYVTVQSSASNRGLDIRDMPSQIEVGNQLGVRLELLVLADAQGQFHWLEGVERGATVALDQVAEADAIGTIREILADAQLRLPPGMQTAGRRGGRSRRRSRFGIPQQVTARPERVMTALTIVPSGPGSGWRKKMYLAIASPPTGVNLGVADPREVASLHVIVGRW